MALLSGPRGAIMALLSGSRGGLLAALTAVLVAMALICTAAQAEEGSFGIESFAVSTSSQQAGAHADLHTEFMLHTNGRGEPVGGLEGVKIRLPPGIAGSPLLIPQCSPTELELFDCQPPAQVGVMTVFYKIGSEPSYQVTVPIYNLAPSPGHSATFATSLLFTKILLQGDLSKDGTDALEVTIQDLSTEIPIIGASLTLWGVPAASTHDLERSRTQLGGPQLLYGPPNEFEEREVIGTEPTPAGVSPAPLLTNSSDCEGPLLTSEMQAQSWEGQSDSAASTMPAPTGCSLLSTAPTISVKPETTERDTPAGYDIDVGYPLDEQPFDLATPALRDATVILPAGTSLSPGVMNGLVGCAEAQFNAGECPNASKVGTATIDSPLAANPLQGTIYLSKPTPEAMYRMFLTVTGEGISVQMTGVIHPNPDTGQLTVVFDGTPQLPFSALDLHLFGGARAALANPVTCGQASTTAEFTSYSGLKASATSSFGVDGNGVGGTCPPSIPFTPGFLAGTLSPRAGGSSPLTFSVTREDGQQNINGITANLPPGLTGLLGKVADCGEPAIAAGNCPESSLLGTAEIGVGAGTSPLYLTGSVYFTGPYKGAPFGLAIVVPGIVGPFNLGTIVVRAQLRVAPGDLHMVIVTDALPQILSGIPLRVRSVSLEINRSGFIVNPTDCAPMLVKATIESVQGTSFSASSPFQVSGCLGLPFTPKMAAATPALASSRGNGAGFDLKITSVPSGQANFDSLIITLPKPLKPRLTAIQKACEAVTFEKNPGECPPESAVGRAEVNTPMLSTPLTGPVYLVYYRGIKYPKVVIVLQGSGVEVRLAGALNISRGIVTTRFRALPDIPMSLFEMGLPPGRHSALGATENLCATPQMMPYTMVAQSGAKRAGTVRITTEGCTASKAKTSDRRAPARATRARSSARARWRSR
jgi:hypothetical protein